MTTNGPFAALSARLTPILEDNTRGEPLRIQMLGEGAPEVLFMVDIRVRTDIAIERTPGAVGDGAPASDGAEAGAQLQILGDAAANRAEFADALRQELAQNPWRVLGKPRDEVHTGTLSDRRSVVLQCGTCRGAGAIACGVCGGHGVVRCHACDGEGAISVVCPDCNGTLEREVEETVLADGDHTPVTSRTSRQACGSCGLTGRILTTCETCRGHGVLNCDNCGGSGRLICETCGGAGQLTEAYSARLMLAHQVDFATPEDAPDFAEDLIARGYARAAARRAFQPTLVEFASDGLAHRAEFSARLPMAAADVQLGDRSFRVEALGAPLELIDPPPVLDEALKPTLERLQRRARGGETAVAAELLRTRVGRTVLEAAVVGSEEAEVGHFRPLLTPAFARDLLSEARASLIAADRARRRRLWTYVALAAPLLAIVLCAFGYVSLIEWISDLASNNRGWTDGKLIIAWIAPFFLFWAASWWAVAELRRSKAETGFGTTGALGNGWDPWGALLAGALFYSIAFLGAAPREGDREELAASARQWAAASFAPLAWTFDGAQTLRWSLQSMFFRELEDYVAPRTRLAEAGPDEWRPIGDEAVAQAQPKADGAPNPVWLIVRCEFGAPVFGLSMPGLRRTSVIEMVVDDVPQRRTLAERRGHTAYWSATPRALYWLREGANLKLTVSPFDDRGRLRRTYDFSLAVSFATTLNALVECEEKPADDGDIDETVEGDGTDA